MKLQGMYGVLRLVLVGALLLTAYPVFCSTYYLDSAGGNDNNDGLSEGTAWQTLDRIESYSAFPGFNAGDTILFKRGKVFAATTSVIFLNSGSPGNYITFGAYGHGDPPAIYLSGYDISEKNWQDLGDGIWFFPYTGSAVAGLWEDGVHLRHASDETLADGRFHWTQGVGIYYRPLGKHNKPDKPANHTLHYSGAAYGITISNLSYLKFSGLRFSIGKHAIGGTAIDQPIHDIIIENDAFDNIRVPIYLASRNGNENHDITIRNNTFTSTNSPIRILAQGNGSEKNYNIIIANNYIYDVDVHDNYHSFRYSDCEAIGLQNVNDSSIYGNVIYDAGHAGIVLWTNPASTSHNNKVQGNIIYDIRGPAISCFSSNTPDSHKGNIISNNITFNCINDGLRFSAVDAPHSNLVANNTMMACGSNIFLSALSSGFDIKNNLSLNPQDQHIYHHGSMMTSSSDYNLFYPNIPEGFHLGYGNNYDFYYWRDVTGNDQNSIVDDPLLSDVENADFTPRPESPVVDAGVWVGLNTDIEGKPVMGNPDIGAHELGSPGFSATETLLSGILVSGDYTSTFYSDDVYEVLTESNTKGSLKLENKWEFVANSTSRLTLTIEAYHSSAPDSDDFLVFYSDNDEDYMELDLRIEGSVDDNTSQSVVLPVTSPGSIYIMITDSNQDRGSDKVADTLYVDYISLD